MRLLHHACVAVIAAATFCAALPISAAQRQTSAMHRRNNAVRAKSAEAVDATFERSDLEGARNAAHEAVALARSGAKGTHSSGALADALFVEMETAALEANSRAELEAALGLCESSLSPSDARADIATSRILDLAANTVEFREAIPRIQSLLRTSFTQLSNLRAALLAAAADGAPGLSELRLARQSNLITDWKISGPFGDFPNVAFEQSWAPERDSLASSKYDGRYVEQFQFPTADVTLPEYFSNDGVFYAVAKVTTPAKGDWRLRIESPGAIVAWIDGSLAITKDDRFHASAETVGAAVTLAAGTHSVLVKFVPAAAPFRVALLPPSTPSRNAAPTSRVDDSFLAAAEAFWAGDYAEAVKALTALREKHDSAVADVLLAQAMARSGSGTEAAELFKAALKRTPSAQAAAYELASMALAQKNAEDAHQLARGILDKGSSFEPATRLLALSATHLGSHEEAEKAWTEELMLHPSCTVVKDAASFFESVGDYSRAQQIETKLQACAPGSLDWARALSRAGRHRQAAAAAHQVVAAFPLDRGARELVVRELSLAGDSQAANTAAKELTELAPNSDVYRRMAAQLENGNELLDSSSANAERLSDNQFYSQFRRDGSAVVKETADRKYSGGQIVVLLNDRVARVQSSGAASVYVHKVTRLLDRDALAKYGEVSVPRDAELLELRTIKSDGSIVEPEFTQHKSTISMAALAPGDAIDVEYVVGDLEGGLQDNADDFEFRFGSFTAPILLSRFVVISAPDLNLHFVPFGHVPEVKVRTNGDSITRVWERDDIPQFTSEVSMPDTGVLPSVGVYPDQDRGWAGVRDFYREEFINAVHDGTRIQTAASELTGTTDEERLRAAYRLVTTRVRRDDADYDSGEIASAEKTLSDFNGSRTAALLAIARAMGISGEVIMAREISVQAPPVPSVHAYTHPLLVFHIPANGSVRDIVLDPETEGMNFGGISARLERHDALRVFVYEPSNANPIAGIPAPLIDDRSVADGDVRFDEEGNLTAHITIRMGAARGAQMRRMLSTVDAGDRKRFFEQLAGRIFPGISYASGEVENEFDSDHPLKLVIDCRASRFVSFGSKLTELDQLVPALGLKSMYSTASTRNTPLMIDTPLIESTSFRIHLPNGYKFLPLFDDVEEQSDFGSYSVTAKMIAADTVQLSREFDVAAQIVAPRQFDSFARFARDVDDAERQHLVVERAGSVTARSHSSVN